MIRLSGEQILALLNAEEPGWARPAHDMPAWYADGVSTDSRSVRPSELFIPLTGERFDGHEYIGMALTAGAAGVLTARAELPCAASIWVPDTRLALQKLASAYRAQFSPTVIGLTGSVGKTTTKELTAAVFSAHCQTMKTNGNFNNDIGVPLTLLRLDPADKAAVIEMGMSHLREIALLTRLACPDIAVITNVGTSHIGNLGSQENICRAKLEILEGLADGGTVVLNGDDAFLNRAEIPAKFRVLKFAVENEKADVRAENICEKEDGSEFSIVWNGKSYPAALQLAGRHHICNALAAFAAGIAGGVAPETAAAALVTVLPEGMRQRVTEKDGCTVIEDCYNANPDSMRAALKVLAGYKNRRKIALLGDMLELGEFADAAHREIGAEAAKSADILLAVGTYAAEFAAGARENGMDPTCIFTPERTDAAQLLREIRRSGDVILVKASRGMRMEEIAAAAF